MGIQGLLPKLKACIDSIHVSRYAHKRVGIDAYCWLHRGAYTSCEEICTSTASVEVKYKRTIDWCIQRVKMLLSYKVIPILIFDGAKLPSKKLTETKRSNQRTAALQSGLQLLAEKRSTDAYKQFSKAINITHEVARLLMNELDDMNIEYYVAPYEADAQLAYMSMQGNISAVISEDSDLLVFGATRILYKMDHIGNGDEIRFKTLSACTEFNLQDFNLPMLQTMSILCGCDYLDSINGIGIQRAYQLVAQHQDGEKIIRKLQFDAKYTIPSQYPHEFEKAQLTFRHQRVYDIGTGKLVHLTPAPDTVIEKYGHELDFLGPNFDENMVEQVCRGRVDPDTHVPFKMITSNNRAAGQQMRLTSMRLTTSTTKQNSDSKNEQNGNTNKSSNHDADEDDGDDIDVDVAVEMEKAIVCTQTLKSAYHREKVVSKHFQPSVYATDAVLKPFKAPQRDKTTKTKAKGKNSIYEPRREDTSYLEGSWLDSHRQLQESLPAHKKVLSKQSLTLLNHVSKNSSNGKLTQPRFIQRNTFMSTLYHSGTRTRSSSASKAITPNYSASNRFQVATSLTQAYYSFSQPLPSRSTGVEDIENIENTDSNNVTYAEMNDTIDVTDAISCKQSSNRKKRIIGQSAEGDNNAPSGAESKKQKALKSPKLAFHTLANTGTSRYNKFFAKNASASTHPSTKQPVNMSMSIME